MSYLLIRFCVQCGVGPCWGCLKICGKSSFQLKLRIKVSEISKKNFEKDKILFIDIYGLIIYIALTLLTTLLVLFVTKRISWMTLKGYQID